MARSAATPRHSVDGRDRNTLPENLALIRGSLFSQVEHVFRQHGADGMDSIMPRQTFLTQTVESLDDDTLTEELFDFLQSRG